MRFLTTILAAVVVLCHAFAMSARAEDPGESNFSLPLVFDPVYKKYFIGANAQFVLKQGADATLLDRIEVSIDGSTFKPYSSAIEIGKEGKHTIKFRTRNAVNNWSPIQFAEVFVDLSPPSTEPKWDDNRAWRDDNRLYVAQGAHLSLVAQDNLSGVGKIEYSWDKSEFLPYLKPLVLEKPGRQKLYYRSTDRVGNVEPMRDLEFVVDGTPPVTVMTVDGVAKQIQYENKQFLGASDGTGFVLESHDELSNVKNVLVSIDGEKSTPYLRPIFFLRDGQHVLKYWGVDRVGNKEEPKVVNIYTVSQAPRTTATAIGKVVNSAGMNFAGREFALKLEARDNVVGLDRIEYKTSEDADFKPYVEPLRFKEQGLHTITYRSVDRAGNVEPTRTYAVTVQWDAPESTLVTSVPLVNKDGIQFSPSPNVISFSIQNTTVGVEKTLISINDAPEKVYKTPFAITNQQKIYKFVYRSIDRLGNEESPKTANIHMITTSPGIDLFVSDGKTKEEKLKTQYFDGAPKKNREVAQAEDPAGEEKVSDAPKAAPTKEAPPEPKKKSTKAKKDKKKKKKAAADE